MDRDKPYEGRRVSHRALSFNRQVPSTHRFYSPVVSITGIHYWWSNLWFSCLRSESRLRPDARRISRVCRGLRHVRRRCMRWFVRLFETPRETVPTCITFFASVRDVHIEHPNRTCIGTPPELRDEDYTFGNLLLHRHVKVWDGCAGDMEVTRGKRRLFVIFRTPRRLSPLMVSRGMVGPRGGLVTMRAGHMAVGP